jgi:hypothetical protein
VYRACQGECRRGAGQNQARDARDLGKMRRWRRAMMRQRHGAAGE